MSAWLSSTAGLAQHEQQLREQIAQEIEAAPKWTGVDSHDTWYLHGLRAAASIARKENGK